MKDTDRRRVEKAKRVREQKFAALNLSIDPDDFIDNLNRILSTKCLCIYTTPQSHISFCFYCFLSYGFQVFSFLPAILYAFSKICFHRLSSSNCVNGVQGVSECNWGKKVVSIRIFFYFFGERLEEKEQSFSQSSVSSFKTKRYPLAKQGNTKQTRAPHNKKIEKVLEKPNEKARNISLRFLLFSAVRIWRIIQKHASQRRKKNRLRRVKTEVEDVERKKEWLHIVIPLRF